MLRNSYQNLKKISAKFEENLNNVIWENFKQNLRKYRVKFHEILSKV